MLASVSYFLQVFILFLSGNFCTTARVAGFFLREITKQNLGGGGGFFAFWPFGWFAVFWWGLQGSGGLDASSNL